MTDLKRATAFYERLLDAKLKPEAFGPLRMACFPYDNGSVSGALVHGEGYEPSAKGTVTYLAATPGIDAALERARAAGARVLLPKMPLPDGMGFIAHIADSEGNRVGLHAMS